VSHTAAFALIGAGLTALGFGIGGDAWGWLVLAAGVVTLVAGLAMMFGVHRFVTVYLLNVWFIIALVLAAEFHKHAHITSYTWAQVPAWAGGRRCGSRCPTGSFGRCAGWRSGCSSCCWAVCSPGAAPKRRRNQPPPD
jgi:hypothetical protein